MKSVLISVFICINIFQVSSAQEWASVDWSENSKLKPGENRENIYKLEPSDFEQVKKDGIKHALVYPVDISGLLIPYNALKNFLEAPTNNPLKKILRKVGSKFSGFDSMEGLYKWIGLNPYNEPYETGIYNIPYPDGTKPDYYMGASIIDTKWGKALTFSCATCHTSNLFGKAVMGLPNKTVRANRFFVMSKRSVPLIPTTLFKLATGATKKEAQMFKRSKQNMKRVGAKRPQTLGLDTSLPQVALSLALRGSDEYASRSKFRENFPRKNRLSHFVSESKPGTWFTLKYKTRWLADGAIVAGNPIYTNFLWNELGRGTDLRELETWMKKNQKTVKELTAAAFATQPPKWTDFFPAKSIDIAKAKRGQKIFKTSCQECHGEYQKKWDQPGSNLIPHSEKIETSKVVYHEVTPVMDMGTDPQRWMGTKEFASSLNKLAISKMMKTVVVPQKGYVPPPLDGIWARYPYLHNNSIPNLCDFLTRPSERTKIFYQGPADDKERDYDSECVGYPVGNKIPSEWKVKERRFDTRKKGLSNMGHSKAFIDKNGKEMYSWNDKKDLIMFLKTL